ncbi:MAG TPA: hypothetical protein VL334_14325 [Anaerolineae bacterium]|nr:hypothetical protein [Anaerolineae bacterium]
MAETKWCLQRYATHRSERTALMVRNLLFWFTLRRYSAEELGTFNMVCDVTHDGRWHIIHYSDGTEERARLNTWAYYLPYVIAVGSLVTLVLGSLLVLLAMLAELGGGDIIAGAFVLVVVGGAILFLAIWMFAFTDTMEKLDDPDPIVRDQAERSAILSVLSDSNSNLPGKTTEP